MRDRSVLVGAVAGALIGLLAVGLVAARGPRSTTTSTSTAAELLAAWRRHRTGTWVVHGQFARTITGQTGGVQATQTVVQRPPDRLSVQDGALDAHLGGQHIVCTTAVDGQRKCTTAPDTVTYDDQVNAEVAGIARLANGAGAPYTVGRSGECFTLSRPPGNPALDRFGVRSTLCFDATTGALVRSEVQRPGATDRFVAMSVTAGASDAEFDPARL